ncbi:MAG: tetratricopeptide repeat protein [Alphaproteobacteria bacterium]|nr:tetratricopeptide repeat protein [Alphaproteobacteria bacterium]
MLIGMKTAHAPVTQNSAADIYDVTTADFETSVLKASMDRPILVDFWAPWCGPCKQLVPMLENTIKAQDGKIALAKVNVDQNPELAQAFRVQSVPMVVAMYMGQPVSAFAGARPQSDIDQLVQQLIALQKQNTPDAPEAMDIPSALKQAQTFIDQGELGAAQEIFAHILMQDDLNVAAYFGLVRVMIAAGDLDQAQNMIDTAPDHIKKDSGFSSINTALDLACHAANVGDLAELEKKVSSNPDDLQSRFDLAEACFAKGEKDRAVDLLIDIIRKDRSWEEDKARAQLLKYLEAWGFGDPASVTGRRKLSSVLFS